MINLKNISIITAYAIMSFAGVALAQDVEVLSVPELSLTLKNLEGVNFKEARVERAVTVYVFDERIRKNSPTSQIKYDRNVFPLQAELRSSHILTLKSQALHLPTCQPTTKWACGERTYGVELNVAIEGQQMSGPYYFSGGGIYTGNLHSLSELREQTAQLMTTFDPFSLERQTILEGRVTGFFGATPDADDNPQWIFTADNGKQYYLDTTSSLALKSYVLTQNGQTLGRIRIIGEVDEFVFEDGIQEIFLAEKVVELFN